MGVAGSNQDSGSEYPGRPSRDVAGAINPLSMGAFPRISIGMLHRKLASSKILRLYYELSYMTLQSIWK